MPAGGLHAYLRGTGIELLANSDNVVRAGLTGKHIDVPELLKLLDPAVSVPVLSPRVLADGVTWFDTPAPEFRLYLVELAGPLATLPGAGPRIVLCLDGACVLRSASGEALELRRGDSCFISAADALVQGRGSARLVLAAPVTRPRGRATMSTSLMPSAGECVEVLRSAIPRLCRSGMRVTSG